MLTRLEKKHGPIVWLIIGIGLVAILGFIDLLTGYEISFSLFYLIPITLVSWQANRQSGFLISLLSAAVWLTADVLAGNSYSNKIIFIWNTCIRLGFFIVTVYLLTALKKGFEREQEWRSIALEGIVPRLP
jgi:hypothetical protein